MAYIQGDLILDDHYNIFVAGHASNGSLNHAVANVNTVWGGGNGIRGYGQGGSLTQVDAGDIVTATQWSTLMGRMTTLGAHQGTTLTGVPTIVVGDLIEAVTTLQTNINNVYNNSTDAAAQGATTTYDTSKTATWQNDVTARTTITFTSADHARYYFNSGGDLRFTFSRVGGSVNDKNAEWTDMCNDAGTVIMGYTGTTQVGGGGSGTIQIAPHVGFYDLNGTNQQLFRMWSDAAAYSSNSIAVNAKISGAAGSNGGVGNVITITVSFIDTDVNPWGQYVDGTITATTTNKYPSTTYLGNSWGTGVVSGSATSN